MKSASSQERTEFILYDVIGGSRAKPIAKLEYSQDQGSSFAEFQDIKTINYNTSNKNNQYNKFILVPPAKTMSADFDNKSEKYSPNSGGTFSDVLKRNLLVKPSFGYETQTAGISSNSISASSYTTLYHTKVFGSAIQNDVTSASSFTNLPNITDSWTFYDSETYDDSTYTPEGYWLSSVTTYPDQYDSLALKTLSMTSDNANIYVYYRASDIETDLTNNTMSFTSLGALSVGANDLTLPDIKEKYFQFAIVFDTGKWATGNITNMSISYETYYEFFEAGQYLVDKPTFKSAFGSYSAGVSCRDYFKKALETDITCPSYSSSTDVAEILRDCCDRAGLNHNDGTELIADQGYTVTIVDDDNFKNEKCLKIFNECMTYLNWQDNNYRLEINSEGYVQLVIKDSTTETADWQLDYRWNLLDVSKAYESDNLAQRITVMAKDHSTKAETELATQNYTTTQSSVSLSWSGDAVYKRVVVVVNSGDGVFSLEETANESITLSITGTSIDVDVTVYGAELETSPPPIGESIYYTNAEYNDGITHKIINRLIQSESEAGDIAKSLTDLYGNPEFVATVKIPYNPLLELGDRLLLWEKYTYSTTIYRIDNISVNYSAENSSLYQTLKLTDLGSDFTNVGWDRNNIVNGGTRAGIDDIDYDTGHIYDYDLGVKVTEDTTDYSYLKEIQFT